MPRCFIAISIQPTQPIHDLVRKLEAMDRSVRAVPQQNLHLTLRFLGDVDEPIFADLVGAIKTATQGCHGFDLVLHGLGAFPHAGRPSSVWIRVKPQAILDKIVKQLGESLHGLGFRSGSKPWVGHVTVGADQASSAAGSIRDVGDATANHLRHGLCQKHRATDQRACPHRGALYRSRVDVVTWRGFLIEYRQFLKNPLPHSRGSPSH